MTSTVYTDLIGPPVNAAWLNDVNNVVYSTGISAANVGYVPRGTNSQNTSVQQKLTQSVSAFDFMTAAEIADVQAGTLLLDVTASVNEAITFGIATAGTVYFPPGKYKLSTLTINGARGLNIIGASAAYLDYGWQYINNTIFSFDADSSGHNGLVVQDFTGVVLKNIFISMRRSSVGGGIACYFTNGSDYIIDNIKLDVQVGTTGVGLQLGNGIGAGAAFTGSVSNIKGKFDYGKGIFANYTTSLEIKTSYIQNGCIYLYGTVYSTITSCAVETSAADGYVIDSCISTVFNGCGAEANAKSAFKIINGALNTTITSPFGSANNTSGDATIGELIQITSDPGLTVTPYNTGGTVIINPGAINPNVASAYWIYGTATAGETSIMGVSTISLKAAGALTNPIGGDATWQALHLTVQGDRTPTPWTPTLLNWTNVGTPTVTASYLKIGKLVYINVYIIPGTSVSCTQGLSQITGIPQAAKILPGGANLGMTNGLGVSFGSCAVSQAGAIFMQTSGVLTTPITLSGTFALE